MAMRRARQKHRPVARKRAAKKRPVARRNPARRSNPHLQGAVKLSDRVEAVLYRHVGSATRAAYKHSFGKGVSLYGLRDGSVLIKSTKPLWQYFTVKGSE